MTPRERAEKVRTILEELVDDYEQEIKEAVEESRKEALKEAENIVRASPCHRDLGDDTEDCNCQSICVDILALAERRV